MIDLIVRMLEIDDHLNRSKNIDIAKGMYKVPDSIREAWTNYKRKKAWQ